MTHDPRPCAANRHWRLDATRTTNLIQISSPKGVRFVYRPFAASPDLINDSSPESFPKSIKKTTARGPGLRPCARACCPTLEENCSSLIMSSSMPQTLRIFMTSCFETTGHGGAHLSAISSTMADPSLLVCVTVLIPNSQFSFMPCQTRLNSKMR